MSADESRVRRVSSSLERNPELDTWLRIHADGTVTIRTGKAELGQGLRTAIARLCAEELEVALDQVHVDTADTSQGPMEFMTVGSMSMEDSGTAVRQVCAEARHHMLERAAKQLGIPVTSLRVEAGEIFVGNARKTSYAEVMAGARFEARVSGEIGAKSPDRYVYVGKPGTRIDLREKLTSGAFLHDLTLDHMLHARVLRPPSYHACLLSLDVEAIRAREEVTAVVRDGSFVAVVSECEASLVALMGELADRASWAETSTLPDSSRLDEFLANEPCESFPVVAGVAVDPETTGPRPPTELPAGAEAHAGVLLSASYLKPYYMHASIGPSVALAHWTGTDLTVWSHSQGVAILRLALAAQLELDRRHIRVIHVAGAGCYGHNGADDAAYEAARIAIALPGRPIRLQWSREEEHTWEPYSPAALVSLSARIGSDGRISAWRHGTRSNTHMGRAFPAGAGYSNFVADWSREAACAPIPAQPRLEHHAGIHRNAEPYYDFGTVEITKHFVRHAPLRVSSTRALGAFANVFAIESFIDELASAAGLDPVELRLRHLTDARARDVLEAVQRHAQKFAELAAPPQGFRRGIGFAFARYKNVKTYAAIAVALQVEPSRGTIRLERAVIAADAGQVIDPDGLTNQLEGGFIQAASWTLEEAVRFDRTRIQSRDWDSYPILRFDQVPDVETVLIDRPGAAILGAGEATQGPTPAAIANAVFAATGARLRELPFVPERVRLAHANLTHAGPSHAGVAPEKP